jgi:hypothetical protein
MTAVLGSVCLFFATTSVLLYRWGVAQRKKPQPSIEAAQMMRDLMNGGATVHVKVLDTDALMIRSPRSGSWR